MVRFNLSKAFNKALSVSNYQRELADSNKDFYKDSILESIKEILAQYSNYWEMNVTDHGQGKASFTLQNTSPAFVSQPIMKFECETETSLLMHMAGRIAAINLKAEDGVSFTAYYGSSVNVDNDYQFLDRIQYQWDIEKIVNKLQSRYYDEQARTYKEMAP